MGVCDAYALWMVPMPRLLMLPMSCSPWKNNPPWTATSWSWRTRLLPPPPNRIHLYILPVLPCAYGLMLHQLYQLHQLMLLLLPSLPPPPCICSLRSWGSDAQRGWFELSQRFTMCVLPIRDSMVSDVIITCGHITLQLTTGKLRRAWFHVCDRSRFRRRHKYSCWVV